MTQTERDIAYALNRCTFLPGSFDKKFVHQLDKWHDKEMTDKGRAYMMRLLDKYKRQIYNYSELKNRVNHD